MSNDQSGTLLSMVAVALSVTSLIATIETREVLMIAIPQGLACGAILAARRDASKVVRVRYVIPALLVVGVVLSLQVVAAVLSVR